MECNAVSSFKMKQKLFFAFVALIVFTIGLAPVLYMVAYSLFDEGRFTLEAYEQVFTSTSVYTLLIRSILLASTVSVISVAIGVLLGLILGKTNIHGKEILLPLFVLPLLIPPYLLAVSWDYAISNVLGTTASYALFGFTGCVLVLSSVFMPIPLLITMFFIKSIPPSLEEAGRISASWREVIWNITLPFIRPGIVTAGLLVFILAFGELSVPLFFRYNVFPAETFTQFAAFYDFKAATASAIPLALFAILILWLIERTSSKSFGFTNKSIAANNQLTIDTKKFNPVLTSCVAIFAVLIVVFPIFSLIVQAQSIDSLTQAFMLAQDSMLRSMVYSGVSASLMVVIGFLVAYMTRYKIIRFAGLVDSTTLLLLILPATLTGIGLTMMWNNKLTHFIYSTPIIIIIGYIAKFLAIPNRMSQGYLENIPPSMDEAARLAGASLWQRILFISIPLMKRGLIAAWLVSFIFSLRDTGITMIVYPPGYDTLPVKIFTLMANGAPHTIASMSLIMILMVSVPGAILWYMVSRRGERHESN